MRLIRVHVATALRRQGHTVLPDGAAQHVRRVLRLRAGDSLTLFNGDGWDYRCRLTALRGERVEAEILERVAATAESPLEVTLAQGVARGERMDLVVQKATELGVARIVPLLTERSVVRLDERRSGRRLAHWQAVATSACEQCGRARLPAVAAPLPLARWLEEPADASLRLLLSPGAGRALAGSAGGPGPVTLLVGPEGGLTDAERDAALRAGFEPCSLGPRILRTETAAIAALAVLQGTAGDLAATPAPPTHST